MMWTASARYNLIFNQIYYCTPPSHCSNNHGSLEEHQFRLKEISEQLTAARREIKNLRAVLKERDEQVEGGVDRTRQIGRSETIGDISTFYFWEQIKYILGIQ